MVIFDSYVSLPEGIPPGQVQFMLDYLGFPDSQDDVDKLLKVLDRVSRFC